MKTIGAILRELTRVGDLPDGVDVSIGTVMVLPDTRDFDPLIDQADRETYRRKRALAS